MRAPRELNFTKNFAIGGSTLINWIMDLKDSIKKTGFLGQIVDKIEVQTPLSVNFS